MSDIHILLLRLGIPPNSLSFQQTAYAISLILQEPDQLHLLTKRLYPAVAKHYQTSASCVEHNIRIAVNHAWNRNPELLTQISCGFLVARPTASEFLSILALHFLT